MCCGEGGDARNERKSHANVNIVLKGRLFRCKCSVENAPLKLCTVHRNRWPELGEKNHCRASRFFSCVVNKIYFSLSSEQRCTKSDEKNERKSMARRKFVCFEVNKIYYQKRSILHIVGKVPNLNKKRSCHQSSPKKRVLARVSMFVHYAR